MKEKVKALLISEKKGEPKSRVSSAEFIQGAGIKGDAHALGGKRQVSLLFEDSLLRMRKKGIEVSAGDMAENLIFSGKVPENLKTGDILTVKSVRLKVTGLGKKCVDMCRIGKELGKCAMSDEGIFLEVISGGYVREGDTVVL